MNEIIQKLMEKTGLPEDKAAAAIQVVMGYLKDKLPGPVSAQVEGLLAGGGTAGVTEKLGGLAQGLGGMLGKK
jgi:uncharacterized protein (DUF2267 family)